MDSYQGSVKGPFSQEDIQEILARANSSQSAHQAPSRTNSGLSRHSKKSPSRTNSGLKHGKVDPDCQCMDCRPADRRDDDCVKGVDAHGNQYIEAKGDMHVRAHLPPGFWDNCEGTDSPPPPRRTSTTGSSKGSKSSRSGSSQTGYARNKDGDMEEFHDGPTPPRVRTHLPATEEYRHLRDDVGH